MIERSGSNYALQCDYCSNSVEDLESFQEAVDYKKANKWKSINFKGEWLDKCPICQEKVEEDKHE